MTRIDVCIATCERPAMLRRLLASIEAQRIPPGVRLHVVVVDNDARRSAEPAVREARARGLAVTYECEPRRNVSLARNRGLRHASGEWIATIDDDAVAAPDWIDRLLSAARRFEADVVFGAVERVLPEGASPALHESGVFELPDPPTGLHADIVYNTINCLFRRALVAYRHEPFAPSYGRTGGEDTELFHVLEHERGARTIWCREAKVREHVLPERASWRWILRRSFREGTTNYRVRRRWNLEPGAPLPVRLLGLLLWTMRMSATITLRMLAGIAHRRSRARALKDLHRVAHEMGIAAATVHLLVVGPREPKP